MVNNNSRKEQELQSSRWEVSASFWKDWKQVEEQRLMQQGRRSRSLEVCGEGPCARELKCFTSLILNTVTQIVLEPPLHW